MTTPKFRFAAALSTVADTSIALDEICPQVKQQLGGPADLIVVFLSRHHAACAAQVATTVCDILQCEQLIGSTGEAIVGGSREIEEQPALVVWAARLPGVTVLPMYLEFARAEGGTFVGWPDSLADHWPDGATLLLLAEPFSFPADVLLERLNEDRPGLAVIGGMASGGQAPGENRILFGRNVHESGGAAVLLSGPLHVRTVVSQGCRPIGQPMVVTKAQQNVILELGGKPALQQLKDLFGTLSQQDQALIQHGLHVGCVINEYQDQFERGDFLVRNVIGFEPDSGAIGIGQFVRVGQTVQFHVRDAQTADEDLRSLLNDAQRNSSTPGAALLFTCNGRGTRLFPEPDHDALALKESLGELPVAGFFAQGEIGPVGGKNFLHGFTASIALFEPSNSEDEGRG